MTLPVVTATRFVAPLREGGSLPGIVEADDLGTYVCKFRGAGQGLGVLVAEVIVSGLAELLGLRTPRLVTVELTEPIARYEADEEVQDLLVASLGLNLGVDFLPGSFGFDSSVELPAGLGAKVLWLDAFTANVDRSWRNPNLLVWHGDVWLIDHGAALYFHHGWTNGPGDPQRFAEQPWSIEDHVMAAYAGEAREIADQLAGLVTDHALDSILARVPDAWLVRPGAAGSADPSLLRTAYRDFLRARLEAPQAWLPGGGAA